MKIAPALQAAIVDGLGPRVRKRVDAFLADPPALAKAVPFGNATVTIAAEVATEPEHLTCDCLLAPNCAHRAAVALLLDVSDAPAEEVLEEPEPAESLVLSEAQEETIGLAWARLAIALQIGTGRLSAVDRAGFAGDLHRMRVHGLVVADRALTGYVTSIGGTPALDSFTAVLLNLHLLRTRPPGVDVEELLGKSRQPYRAVGGLNLVPLFAEAILTASGFAGAQVTFAAAGRTWTLARLRPGGRAEIPERYWAGDVWAGVSDPLAVLSRHRLLVSDATARLDGRLGGGRQVRAARSAPVLGWDEVPAGFTVVSGPVTGGDRRGLDVDGRRLLLTPTARALGAGLATELFGAALGTPVTCLVRGDDLLGLRSAGGAIHIPDGLGVWWPGLDDVDRSWAGELTPRNDDRVFDPADWDAEAPNAVAVTRRWCRRILEAGAGAAVSPSLDRDSAWLAAAGAPFAARLLRDLADAAHQGERRFDGTWAADPERLVAAWLALSQY